MKLDNIEITKRKSVRIVCAIILVIALLQWVFEVGRKKYYLYAAKKYYQDLIMQDSEGVCSYRNQPDLSLSTLHINLASGEFRLFSNNSKLDSRYFPPKSFEIPKEWKRCVDSANSKSLIGAKNAANWGIFDEHSKQDVVNRLKIAADLGDPESQYILARFFQAGHLTVKNEKLALEYFQRASRQGFVRAQVAAATILLRDPQTEQIGMALLRAASASGNCESTCKLAELFLSRKDAGPAYFWSLICDHRIDNKNLTTQESSHWDWLHSKKLGWEVFECKKASFPEQALAAHRRREIQNLAYKFEEKREELAKSKKTTPPPKPNERVGFKYNWNPLGAALCSKPEMKTVLAPKSVFKQAQSLTWKVTAFHSETERLGGGTGTLGTAVAVGLVPRLVET